MARWQYVKRSKQGYGMMAGVAEKRPTKALATADEFRTFPLRLRLARETAKLTGVELSDKCGIDQSVISRYENGKRVAGMTANSVILLANALGVRSGWLLSGEEPMYDPKARTTFSVEDDTFSREELVRRITELERGRFTETEGPADEPKRPPNRLKKH